MIAGGAITRFAERLVVAQVRKTSRFSSKSNAIGENSGKEERLVPDMRANVKTRRVIGRLQRRQHLEEIIQRLTVDLALHLFGARVIRQYLGHVIGHVAV